MSNGNGNKFLEWLGFITLVLIVAFVLASSIETWLVAANVTQVEHYLGQLQSFFSAGSHSQ